MKEDVRMKAEVLNLKMYVSLKLEGGHEPRNAGGCWKW